MKTCRLNRFHRRRRNAGLGLAEFVLFLTILMLLSVTVTTQIVFDTQRASTVMRSIQLQFYAEAFLTEPLPPGNRTQTWLVTDFGLLPAESADSQAVANERIIDEIKITQREASVSPTGRRVVLVLSSRRTSNAALVEKFYE